jgi:hypothetical protein
VYERYLVEEVEVSYPRKLEVMWANDVFFQTDRYYTNGLEFEYFSQSFEHFGVAKLLLDPGSESGPLYSLTLSHDIFTPKNVLGDPEQSDRPYAGVLMFGLKAVHFSTSKNFRFTSEIQAGLLGEMAGGRFVQNGIHVLLPASEPIPGWSYQIDHDLCAQYNIGIEKLLLKQKWFEADLLAKARMGLPYTDFSGGARIRAGKAVNYYAANEFLNLSNSQFYLFAEANLRTVFYDATLQGGAFNSKNPHTIINTNPFVGDIKFGTVIKYKSFTTELGAQMLSPKFEDAFSHKWAYFKFAFLF